MVKVNLKKYIKYNCLFQLKFSSLDSCDDININIENIDQIRKIAVIGCGMKNIGSNILILKNTDSISFASNQLKTVEKQFNSFYRLKMLNLQNNKISSVHPDAFNLILSLTVLDLSYNSLDEQVLQPISRIKALRALYLSGNSLKKVKASLGALLNLEILALNDNQITAITEEIGNLKKLKECYLQNNGLLALPIRLGETNMKSIGCKLEIYNNPFVVPGLSTLMDAPAHKIVTYLGSADYKECIVTMRLDQVKLDDEDENEQAPLSLTERP